MNEFTIKKLLLIIVLAFVSFSLTAQEAETKTLPKEDFKGHIYVTSSLGANILTGDINKIKPSFDANIGVGWQFINWLSVKGNFGTGALRGQNTNENGFNIFKGNYIEANLSLNLSFIDLVAGYNPNRLVSVTPHVGIGTFQYRLKTKNDDGTQTNVGIKLNQNYDADEIIKGKGYKERYSVMEVPMGVEVGFRISKRWDLFLDCTTTWTNSDLVDGHAIGKNNDWITTFNVGAKHRILRDSAQIASRAYCSNWFVTFDGGPFYALGDVRKAPLFKDTKYNFNIGGGYKWGRCWKVYGKIGFASFTQQVRDNETNEVVYTCDEGNQISGDINLGFDIINAIKYKNDRLVSLYLHAGVGMIQYKSKGTYLARLNDLPYYPGDVVYQGYGEYEDDMYHQSGKGIAQRRVVASVPVGMELNFRLNDHWDIYGDGTVSFFDGDLVNGIMAGKWYDWSFATNVGVRYNFKKNCPVLLEEEKPTPQIIPEEEEEEIVEVPVVRGTRSVTREEEVVIQFRWYSSELGIPENKQILADFLEQIGDKTIKTVIITAYASPEGSDKLNKDLALRRAYAAKDFVVSELKDNVKDADFIVEGYGADWPGFMELLEKSNIEKKAEIAEKLNNANPATRYKTLYALSLKYPEIKELYPPLRKAVVGVKVIIKFEDKF